MAGGWFLVIFHALSLLCIEGVVVHGSVGGCVGRLCRCLCTAGMWRALFVEQYLRCPMLQVRIIVPLSVPLPFPSVSWGSQCTIIYDHLHHHSHDNNLQPHSQGAFDLNYFPKINCQYDLKAWNWVYTVEDSKISLKKLIYQPNISIRDDLCVYNVDHLEFLSFFWSAQ